MNVAVSAQGTTLDAAVDPRFGRCQQILVINTDTFEYTVMSNPNIGASGGAGIQTAQMLSTKDIKAVLTGHCGPNAFRTLQAASIPVYVDVAGTVREAVERYNSGQIQPADQANTPSHSGTPGGRGRRNA
jgi:predicted Fe-Mo cluster-binding NifX family protein